MTTSTMAPATMVMMMVMFPIRIIPVPATVVVVSSLLDVIIARAPRAVGRLTDDHEPGVEHAWQPAQEREDDADEEGGAAAGADEDGEGWDEERDQC